MGRRSHAVRIRRPKRSMPSRSNICAMKTILTLVMIAVVVAPSRAAVDLEKDRNRAVDEIYRRASLRAEAADVAGLPKRIACDDGGDVLYRGVDTLSPTSGGRAPSGKTARRRSSSYASTTATRWTASPSKGRI